MIEKDLVVMIGKKRTPPIHQKVEQETNSTIGTNREASKDHLENCKGY